jgi:hypothetical protein
LKHKIGSVQVGSRLARPHDLQSVEADFTLSGLTEEPHGTVRFTVEKPDKCVRLWLNTEGIIDLLTEVIGSIPTGYAISSKRLTRLCTMIMSTHYDSRVWRVQKGTRGDTGAYVWEDMAGIYEEKQDALTAAIKYRDDRYRHAGVLYRLCERYDHPSDPV